MQKGLCKILLFTALACSTTAFAMPVAPQTLKKADSLYTAKQYTQAFELYNSLYANGNYSAAMLLKMAYIHEGLGHLGESLFYLNLYYLASDDPQALRKMEELAEKNHLEGYAMSETTQVFSWLQENYFSFALVLASLNLLLLAVMFYQHTKLKVKPLFAGFSLLLLTFLLYAHVNFSKEARFGIVAQTDTYLMSGPSAAASVVAIVGESRLFREVDVSIQQHSEEKE